MPTTALQDSFTDTNGTSLDLHTMNTGPGWTTTGSHYFDITSNHVIYGATAYAYSDASHADVVMTCDGNMQTLQPWAGGLIGRVSDSSNYWFYGVENDGGTAYAFIIERVAGGQTVRATNDDASAVNTITLTVTLSGTSHDLLLSSGGHCTYTSSSMQSNTSYGMRALGDSGYRSFNWWDNFLVTYSSGTVNNLTLSVTSTCTPSFIKAVGKILSTTRTCTPSFIRGMSKTALLTVTSTPTVVRSTNKILSMVQTCTSSIIKSCGKIASVGSTCTTSILRSVGKILSTTRTCTATLVSSFTTLKILSLTSSSTTSLLRSTNKILSFASTSAVSIVKAIAKKVSITSTLVPSAIKSANKGMSTIVTTCTATLDTLKVLATSLILITKRIYRDTVVKAAIFRDRFKRSGGRG